MNNSTKTKIINQANKELKEQGIDREIFDIHNFIPYGGNAYKGSLDYHYTKGGDEQIIYTNNVIVKSNETYVQAILEQMV